MPGRNAGRGGKSKRIALTNEVQRLNREDAERNRAATGDPLTPPPATGKPFDPESAKKAVEARERKRLERQAKEEAEAEALAKRLEQANLTEEDRALALERLRHLRDSPDEKVAATAATKLLDIYSKENQDHGPSVVRYESAFIDPEAT